VIIDAFLGFNEIQLAKFRINYLRGLVDVTYILEGNLSHSGDPKGFWFSELPQDYWGDSKVEIIRHELNIADSPLTRERESRRFLVDAIMKVSFANFFILSDLDEIPSRAQIEFMRVNPGLYHFESPTFLRYGNWLSLSQKNREWRRGVMGLKSMLSDQQGHRFASLPKITEIEAGGHFSYMQHSPDSIQRKLESFYHTEFKTSLNGEAKTLEFCDKFGISHLGTFDDGSFGLLEILEVQNLSGIQAQLHIFSPKYFRFVNLQQNKASRILASLLISTFTRSDSSKHALFRQSIEKSPWQSLLNPTVVAMMTNYLLFVWFRHAIMRVFFMRWIVNLFYSITRLRP
jgi:hypothetical protein